MVSSSKTCATLRLQELRFNAPCLKNETSRKMGLQSAKRRGDDSRMICPPELRPLALVREYPELVEALRARAEELNVSRETIDSVSGLQSGYSAKLLCQIKGVGRTSLGPILGSMGLVLVVMEDPAQLARVRSQLVPRYPQGHRVYRSRRPDPGRPCSCAEFRQAAVPPPWPLGPDMAVPTEAP
jgi:hypothetical protein